MSNDDFFTLIRNKARSLENDHLLYGSSSSSIGHGRLTNTSSTFTLYNSEKLELHEESEEKPITVNPPPTSRWSSYGMSSSEFYNPHREDNGFRTDERCHRPSSFELNKILNTIHPSDLKSTLQIVYQLLQNKDYATIIDIERIQERQKKEAVMPSGTKNEGKILRCANEFASSSIKSLSPKLNHNLNPHKNIDTKYKVESPRAIISSTDDFSSHTSTSSVISNESFNQKPHIIKYQQGESMIQLCRIHPERPMRKTNTMKAKADVIHTNSEKLVKDLVVPGRVGFDASFSQPSNSIKKSQSRRKHRSIKAIPCQLSTISIALCLRHLSSLWELPKSTKRQIRLEMKEAFRKWHSETLEKKLIYFQELIKKSQEEAKENREKLDSQVTSSNLLKNELLMIQGKATQQQTDFKLRLDESQQLIQNYSEITIPTLQNDLAVETTKNETLQKEFNSIQQEHKKLEDQLEVLKEEAVQHRQQLNDSTEQIRQVETENDELKTTLLGLTGTLATLRDRYQMKNEDLHGWLLRLKETNHLQLQNIEDKGLTISNLRLALQTNIEDSKLVKQKLNTAEIENESLKNQLHEPFLKVKELQVLCNDLYESNDELNNELNCLKTEYSQRLIETKSNHQQLEEDNAKLLASTVCLKKEKKILSEQLEKAQESLSTRMNESVASRVELESEIIELKAKLSQLETCESHKSLELVQLREKCEQLKTERILLMKQIKYQELSAPPKLIAPIPCTIGGLSGDTPHFGNSIGGKLLSNEVESFVVSHLDMMQQAQQQQPLPQQLQLQQLQPQQVQPQQLLQQLLQQPLPPQLLQQSLPPQLLQQPLPLQLQDQQLLQQQPLPPQLLQQPLPLQLQEPQLLQQQLLPPQLLQQPLPLQLQEQHLLQEQPVLPQLLQQPLPLQLQEQQLLQQQPLPPQLLQQPLPLQLQEQQLLQQQLLQQQLLPPQLLQQPLPLQLLQQQPLSDDYSQTSLLAPFSLSKNLLSPSEESCLLSLPIDNNLNKIEDSAKNPDEESEMSNINQINIDLQYDSQNKLNIEKESQHQHSEIKEIDLSLTEEIPSIFETITIESEEKIIPSRDQQPLFKDVYKEQPESIRFEFSSSTVSSAETVDPQSSATSSTIEPCKSIKKKFKKNKITSLDNIRKESDGIAKRLKELDSSLDHLHLYLIRYSTECRLAYIDVVSQTKLYEDILGKTRQLKETGDTKRRLEGHKNRLRGIKWILEGAHRSREESAKLRFELLLDIKEIEDEKQKLTQNEIKNTRRNE